MPIVTFKPVERRGSRVIITAYSDSGGGKTLSLLRLGRGLVGPEGKLCMIDTENGRGRIYAGAVPGGYDYAELTAPFSPDRYIQAIDDAEEAGYGALVLDSGSHEWASVGGVLEIADESGAKGLLKWMAPKAKHKKYVQRLLRSQMHILISLRAKEKFVQLAKGDVIPEGMKIGDIISTGLIPIQDKRFVYETTVQLFFPTGGVRGVPSLRWPEFKCPADLEGAFPPGEQITEETGRRIAEWVAGGTPVDRQFEELKRRAEDAAAGGTEEYRKFWTTAGAPTQKRLAETHENNKSIATEADKRLASAAVGIAADVIDATPAETLALRLAAASTIPEVDAIEDEWREPMSQMSHEDWLAAQAAIDRRRVELEVVK